MTAGDLIAHLPDGYRAGPDYRLPDRRRAVFHDFYEFHLRYGAHPGCVYYLMPWLREHFGWDDEEALWFAFLNGNTQNPITSLLLHARAPAPRPEMIENMLGWWRVNYPSLAWDTDRRYHKKSLDTAVYGYLELVKPHGSQRALWNAAAAGGFASVWAVATAIPTFGRLSAFSYGEYLRIMGADFDCDNLFLDDLQGSKSHRNGICKVLGLDRYDWHDSNPDFDGAYPPGLMETLKLEGAMLLSEARARAAGHPWEHDVSYFTLESALCTYKSWHRPNRRYANVYNDMLYNRIRHYEAVPVADDYLVGVFWDARHDRLPAHLRLEDQPHDPGLVPLKQNWYRETGEVIMMDVEYPQYRNGFNDGVRNGRFGLRDDVPQPESAEACEA